MARKNYSEEFRRQAVDLYESTPGGTLRGIAVDLGIVRGTLSHSVDLHGTGKKTTTDGVTINSPSRAREHHRPPGVGPESPEVKVARLEAENAELRAERTVLRTEREILRATAEYFAGATNW